MEERFSLHPDPEAARFNAEQVFSLLLPQIATAVPVPADVDHVGATAVPGAVTKGDLDICVRVAAADFMAARDALSSLFSRNALSVSTDDFQAFQTDHGGTSVGIQLTAAGGEYDVFVPLRDLLRKDRVALRRMNELKQRHNGGPMDDYRIEKGRLIEQLLRDDRQRG